MHWPHRRTALSQQPLAASLPPPPACRLPLPPPALSAASPVPSCLSCALNEHLAAALEAAKQRKRPIPTQPNPAQTIPTHQLSAPAQLLQPPLAWETVFRNVYKDSKVARGAGKQQIADLTLPTEPCDRTLRPYQPTKPPGCRAVCASCHGYVDSHNTFSTYAHPNTPSGTASTMCHLPPPAPCPSTMSQHHVPPRPLAQQLAEMITCPALRNTTHENEECMTSGKEAAGQA